MGWLGEWQVVVRDLDHWPPHQCFVHKSIPNANRTWLDRINGEAMPLVEALGSVIVRHNCQLQLSNIFWSKFNQSLDDCIGHAKSSCRWPNIHAPNQSFVSEFVTRKLLKTTNPEQASLALKPHYDVLVEPVSPICLPEDLIIRCGHPEAIGIAIQTFPSNFHKRKKVLRCQSTNGHTPKDINQVGERQWNCP